MPGSLLAALPPGTALLMDGAMGTALLASGLDASPRCVLSHAEQVHAIHSASIAAGARVLLTCTFQSNPIALARLGLEPQLERINQKAIHLARRAMTGGFVLGDVGPIHSPGRSEEFTDRDALHRTVASMEGVDGILFETCSSPAALSAVAYARHRIAETEAMPLLLSLTYHRNSAGQLVTFSGHGPETYARHAIQHGVAALGVNCGKDIDLADIAEILRRYRQHTDLPLFARPNAGTPDATGQHPRLPEEMAQGLSALVAAGASMIGGCCGTTATHLRAFAVCLAACPSRSTRA